MSSYTSSSKTVLDTIEWIKRFIFLRPMAIGNFLEPALTSANIIMQTIVGPPFFWRWNRVTTGFITAVGQQDYTVFNWKASFEITTAYVLVDSNGNCQACTTAGTTGTVIPTFNSTKGQTTTDGNAVWTNMGSIGTPVSTTYTFGWIETVSLKATNPNVTNPYWKEIRPKITLALESAQERPQYIAAQYDNGNGDMTFRLMSVPDDAYPVAITVQQKAPVFTSLNQSWAPIPDEYSMLYNWGMMAMMMLYADDVSRYQFAVNKFIAGLLSTHQGLTQTEKNIVLNNWQMISGQPMVMNTNDMQGDQVRTAL